jgi:hypothetical protein
MTPDGPKVDSVVTEAAVLIITATVLHRDGSIPGSH